MVYFLLDILGQGQQATVFFAKKRAKSDLKTTLETVAVRMYNHSNFHSGDPKNDIKTLERFNREQLAQQELRSPHLIAQKELIKTGNAFYQVMEFANGGTLFDVMRQRKKLTEKEAWHVIKSVLLGVRDLQDKLYMHRDIKADNIVLHWPEMGSRALTSQQKEELYACNLVAAQVKLCDLGFVRKLGPQETCVSFDCGNL